MSKILASFLIAFIQAATFFLPRWRRLTVRARLYDKLQPFEAVKVGEKTLNLFTPNRTCVYWAKEGPDSEPATNAWINSFSQDDTFVDVGANIGLYSLMAAAQGVSKVYAIEPNPFSYSVLARNICANGFDSIIVPLCLAMNEESSIVSFKLNGPNAGTVGNNIIDEELSQTSVTVTMASFSLDELFRVQGIRNVTHLKIDVDGIELEILRGATDLLADHKLKSILIEDVSGNESEASELSLFIEKFGFHETHAWGRDGTCNKIFVR